MGGMGGAGGFNFGGNQMGNRMGNMQGMNQGSGSPCVLVSNLDEEVCFFLNHYTCHTPLWHTIFK